ncbi:ankyrin repeat domain-containing protein 9 [Eucyclogobius newberryi]|uniref:ankyrin repeat domain-containing protein 9 n=1 Tax=Eucyclogobius newberryi TaxID=166745 RepID=UPI003B5B406B
MSSAVCLEQRRCLSLLFYRAVRDQKPVWMLEDMRTMLALCPDDGNNSQKTYSPSEALLYAIVHDHQGYAQYLLSHFPEEALVEPGEGFCRCPTPAPHLSLAVRHDRYFILGHILQMAHRVPSGAPAIRGGRVTQGDGRTPLHLACELVRPEAVLLLLGSGASPVVPDAQGLTPLDVLLEPLRDCDTASSGRRHCLDTLLMFMPRVHFHLREALRKEPLRWSGALGHDTVQFLAGFRPAPLLLSAMQTVFQQLSPTTFSDSLLQLPIPSNLKPAGLTLCLPQSGDKTVQLHR